jgi:hypothetical protein
VTESAAIAGGCLCGACRYRSEAAPLNVRACHCRRCQKATGAPLYARVAVPIESVEITGPVRWFDAGTGVRRGFCPECGSTLFSERAAANMIGLTMGTLDTPDLFAPEQQIWVSDKQAWLPIDPALPTFAENPPA